MTEGGGGRSGYSYSEEDKQKMSEKRKGEGNSNAKITENLAKEIKIRLASGDKIIDIVEEFGVNKKIVHHIKYLTSWKHLLPVLNDLLKEETSYNMSEDIARDIKIRLSQGEKINDLASEHNVSRDSVRQIKNLNSWRTLLPELNDVKYIDAPRVVRRINKNNNEPILF